MSLSFIVVLIGAALLTIVCFIRVYHAPPIMLSPSEQRHNRVELFVLATGFGFMLKHVLLGTANWMVGVIMIAGSLVALRIYAKLGWIPTVPQFWLIVKARFVLWRTQLRRRFPDSK